MMVLIACLAAGQLLPLISKKYFQRLHERQNDRGQGSMYWRTGNFFSLGMMVGTTTLRLSLARRNSSPFPSAHPVHLFCGQY